MIRRDSTWVDQVFNYSVKLLYEVANYLGMTYEEVNVYLFCIIWPLVTLALSFTIVTLLYKGR